MADDANKRGQFLDQFGFAISPDGKIVELKFVRTNGNVISIPCDYGRLSTVVLLIEQAAAKAYDLQKAAVGGIDPRLFDPLTTHDVERLQGAYTRDGKPIITLVLKSGLRINALVLEDDIPELIAWLEVLERSRRTAKPDPN
jgi:hypothetical protein